MKKHLLLILSLSLFLSLKAQTDDQNIARQLLNKNYVSLGVTASDIQNVIISDSYFNQTAGTRMVYLQQSYLGLPVYNQLQVVAFKNNAVVSTSGGRIAGIEKLVNSPQAIPQVSAEAAVMAALSDRKIIAKRSPVVISSEKNGHLISFDNLDISRENITAELMWVPAENSKKLILSWQVYFIPIQSSDYWVVRVNAIDKSIVGVNNLTVYCKWEDPSKKSAGEHDHNTTTDKQQNHSIPLYGISLFDFKQVPSEQQVLNSPTLINNASYRVVPFPAESPIHTGGTPALRTNPWSVITGNATSLKWHNNGTTDFTYTRGNNVWALEDRDGSNATIGLSATSNTASDPLNFDFTPSFTTIATQTTPIRNQQFNITNLFYWNNTIHDIMYQYGFDEPSGNFQASNQGRGGAENDYVYADAQDGSGTNNANFSTPADGSNGRMQMFLWNGSPQKDGDVDNGIVTHEFAHGISNRLTGGPSQAGCLSNEEQMGEGWSDYYGLMFTQDWATANVNTGFNSPRGIGTYVIGQAATGSGIRSQKYCTNFSVNNKVYAASIDAESHNRGEIWCATLWDMTWNIIQQVGVINPNIYNVGGGGGNTIALKLVTEGLKLQPCSPGFIDGRDAILQADQLLYGGAYNCAIREAFRRRGMGAIASQGSSTSVTDQIADYSSGSATLGLTQSVTQAAEGQNITFTNTIKAGACGGISNFVLTDTLPLNVNYISGGTYNATNRVVSFSVTLTASQTQTYSFTVQVKTGAYYPTVTLFEDNVLTTTMPTTWTVSSTTAGTWSVSSARSFSASKSYYANNLDIQSDQKLTLTNSINLGATPPNLSFRHWYSSESKYDGGVLEISNNNGSTWTDMQSNFISGGYTTTMDATTLIPGRNAWSGSSSNKFIKTKVNLAPYANQNVLFRFRFTSDVGTNLEGWYVDDIAIKNQALVEIQSNLFNATNIRVAISDTFTIIIPAPACVATSITSQPSNATVCAGNSTTFNTIATGTTPSYQWQVSTDGGISFVNISGANSASYTLTNITAAQHNNKYRVITSNACPSSTTSAAAILSVNTSPSITTQPVNQLICEGGSTSFSINANGTANLYQWQVSTDGGLNFANVSGATSASYTLTNITSAQHNNQYRVVVSNVCLPSTTSVAAILSVNIPASITNQPVNQVVCEGENASFSISANGTANFYQWQESTDGGATFTNIIGETNPTLILNNITASLNNHQYHVMITSCGTGITSMNVNLTVNSSARIVSQPSSIFSCIGNTATFSATASGTNLAYQWQISTDGGNIFLDIPGEVSATLQLNNITGTMNNNQYRVVVTSVTCSGVIFSNAATLSLTNNTAITAQPSAATACEGSNTQFSVAVTGGGLTFQWQKSIDGGVNFTYILGETNATINLNNIPFSMDGQIFKVLIFSACSAESISSANALLHILPKVDIVAQPSNITTCINTTATFNATVTGNNLIYQWQVSTDGGTSFADITGANTNSLSITGVTANMNNNLYRLISTGAPCGSLISDTALLLVSLPSAITSQPSSITTCENSSATFSVTATGNAVSYQWQVSTDGGINFSNITGANASTYVLSNATLLENDYQYHVLMSGDCFGAATSTPATLTVSGAPAITIQPNDIINCAGTTASFSTTASGLNLTYQWQVSTNGGTSFSNVTGANAATLSITNVTSSINGNLYRVVIGNSICATSTTSNNALLTVNDLPAIASQPVATTLCVGSNYTFTSSATGTGIGYQWQLSTGGAFVDISGAINSSYTISNVSQIQDGNQYRLFVTGICLPSAISNSALLTVVSPETINNAPASDTVCSGSNASFSIIGNGNNLLYQWQVSTNGGISFSNVPGATAATLSIPNVTGSSNGNLYQVLLSNTTCAATVTSNADTLRINELPVVSITASPSNVIEPGQTITLSASSSPASSVYNWYLNGSIINNQSGNSIQLHSGEIGAYTAISTVNGCKNTSNVIAVKDTLINYTFIYPNPNGGHFQIRYEGVAPNGQPRIITMYDEKGSKVYSKSFVITTTYQPMDVLVQSLPNGIYLLVLSESNGNRLKTGKVIIHK